MKPPALSTSPSGSGGRSPGRLAYLAATGVILFFLLAPLAVVAVFALNPTPFIQFPPVGVTMRWFAKFFASPEFMGSLRLSLEVAGAVVVLATLIGAAAALALARGSRNAPVYDVL